MPEDTIEEWTTLDQMIRGWEVVRQMYPEMSQDTYQARLSEALAYNFRQFAYVSHGGQCLGVVGLWLFTRVWCGLEANLDHFVVDAGARRAGIGKRLLDHGLAYARSRGANVATLDTYVDNFASHRLYHREGFALRGYHFVRFLDEGTRSPL